MGLFSRNKKENSADMYSYNSAQTQNSQPHQKVPSSLPNTAVDELENKQPQNYQQTQSLEQQQQQNYQITQSPVQNPPTPQSNHSVDDQRRISPEILSDSSKKSRIPMTETRYFQASEHKLEQTIPVQQHQINMASQSTQQDQEVPKPSKQEKEHVEKSHFFAQLEKMFSKKGDKIHKYTSKDLVSKMKEYHDSVKTGHGFFLHEGDVEKQIHDKVSELKKLEAEWVSRKKESEAAEMFLLEKELQIETKLEEMKTLVSSADKYRLFYTHCPSDKTFILNNGHVLNSIQELLYYLPHMSDDLFEHHVNGSRNDFSSWIKFVFQAENLADALMDAHSRQDMIKILKSF